MSYGDKAFVWTKGKLTRLYDNIGINSTSSSEDVRFTYNAYGQRTSKVYEYDPGDDYSGNFTIGKDTTYDYDSSGRLIREFSTEYFTESDSIDREFIYLYDESGIIGAMYSYNGLPAQPYYYDRNHRGDVIAIYDANGNKKAGYAYDAFGNCKVIYEGSGTDIASINPIRYRGYYYDTETKLYYLNARYYNPQWRRFISPDSTEYLDPESVNGLNLYCYCNNDPINYCDPSGNLGISLAVLGAIIFGVVGATVGGVVAYNVAKDNGAEGWNLFGGTMLGVVGGGIIGTLAGAGIGALITKATGILGYSIIKGNVFTVTKTMVIGHYGYASVATSLGYGFYQISNELYNSMSDIQRWEMNSQFLDDCAKLGANFLVEATRVISSIYNGNISYLYYEIQYLLQKGYVWLEDLSGLIKP